MQKSPDAFRTISEVAADLDLPQHVLRFWETRFTTIRPLKRGGGRRYYRPDDVDLLKGIRHLLYGQGYTIKGVQRILKEDGLRFVQALGRGEGDAASVPLSVAEDEEFAAGPPPGTGSSEDAAEEPDIPRASIRAVDLSTDQTARLQSVLAELLECERILESLHGE